MTKIILILCLLFGFNTYAMQAPLKRDSVEYKALYSKSDSKVATPKKVKKISPIKKVFMIFQIVIYSIVFILLLAITLSKP